MADPKGIYNSPSERGLATVLPASPNIAGMMASFDKNDIAKSKLAYMARAKAEADRKSVVDKVYSDLSKPVVTDQLWQAQLDGMKSGYLSGIEKMSDDPSKMRMASMEAVQDMASYSKAAKDVAKRIGDLNKSKKIGKYEVFNTDAIRKDMAGTFVGEDGKMVDPRQVDLDGYTLDEWVYGKSGGGKYINEGEAIKAFVNSDAFKNSILELDEMGKPVGMGNSRVGVKTTKTTMSQSPFVRTNPVTGEVSVIDPKGLIDSGLIQVAMNDKPFARLVQDDVDRYLAEKDKETMSVVMGSNFNPPQKYKYSDLMSNEDMDYLWAEMAVAKLGGYQYRGNVFKERESLLGWNKPRPRAAGKETAAQRKFKGEGQFMENVLSNDLDRINDALSFTQNKGDQSLLLPKNELGNGEEVLDVQGTTSGFMFRIGKRTSSGNVVKDDNGRPETRLKLVPKDQIDEEVLRNYYREAAFKNKRDYLSDERGNEEEPAKVETAPSNIVPILPGGLNKRKN